MNDILRLCLRFYFFQLKINKIKIDFYQKKCGTAIKGGIKADQSGQIIIKKTTNYKQNEILQHRSPRRLGLRYEIL